MDGTPPQSKDRSDRLIIEDRLTILHVINNCKRHSSLTHNSSTSHLSVAVSLCGVKSSYTTVGRATCLFAGNHWILLKNYKIPILILLLAFCWRSLPLSLNQPALSTFLTDCCLSPAWRCLLLLLFLVAPLFPTAPLLFPMALGLVTLPLLAPSQVGRRGYWSWVANNVAIFRHKTAWYPHASLIYASGVNCH